MAAGVLLFGIAVIAVDIIIITVMGRDIQSQPVASDTASPILNKTSELAARPATLDNAKQINTFTMQDSGLNYSFAK